MALTALPRIVSLTIIPFLIAVSTAIAQAPKVPAARFHHSGVYDEARKEFLIYGGYTWDQGTKKLGDVWGWNGSTWQLVGDTGVRKIVAPLAFDSKRQRTVVFGGSGDSDGNDGKLRRLEGETWQVVKDVPYLGREDASLAYDSKEGSSCPFWGEERRSSLRRYLGVRWQRFGNRRLWRDRLYALQGPWHMIRRVVNDLVWRVSASCCSW